MNKCFETEKKFLVSGGLQRKNVVVTPAEIVHRKARLIEISWNEKRSEVLNDYVSPADVCPAENPSIRYTSMTLEDGLLYLCTGTEIFVYKYPDMVQEGYASLPSFNDIHHVLPVEDKIAVVSTGLDMIVFLDRVTLQPVDYKNALFREPWHRYNANTDYRKINSTNPHEAHPNYLFRSNGKLWVTRCQQRDAVCLDNPDMTIPMGVDVHIHDGNVIGEQIFFTSVDGKIIIVNKNENKVREIIDLNEIEKNGRPLGWCRGICLDGDIVYVGFTQIRQTVLEENIRWLLKFSGDIVGYPSRIVAYDIKKKVKVDEYIFPPGLIHDIFSIIEVDVKK